jgi:signal transduction histidine kinase
MRIILSYLRSRMWALLAACAFGAIFAAVFYLYRLPVEAVGYALLLCLFPGAPLIAVDFLAFRKRHALLAALLNEVGLSLDGLPAPASQIEADYQALLRELFRDRALLRDGMERGYRDLTDYYTMWAHQIKTPIAAMRLILQTEDAPDSPELAGQLQRIEQYVEMVLCYLRLDSESTDYVIRTCDLDKIVRACARKYAGQFIRKKLRFELRPIRAEVLTDEKWLSFVIEQIFSNAIKYTRSGGVFVSFEAPATLTIRDTGIGIAPEDLPRVFEKGYTGLNGRDDKRATGIGLYLSRRILLKLGHGIRIESEPDVGTTVRLDLESRKLDFE